MCTGRGSAMLRERRHRERLSESHDRQCESRTERAPPAPAHESARRCQRGAARWRADDVRLGGRSELDAAGLVRLQIIYASCVQIGFLIAAPQLAVLFLVGLTVIYNFAMLSFEPREFTIAWLSMGLAAGVALYAVHERFRFPSADGFTAFALWAYFVLCLRQLSGIGMQLISLRGRLSERNADLSESLTSPEALADQERLIERERVARELHDTLVQGMQGLLLRFQAAASRVPSDSPARALLEQALEQADRVLLEGRDRLTCMRLAGSGGADLPDALWAAGEELTSGENRRFRLVTHGAQRKLRAQIEERAYRIGRDALLTAFQEPRVGAVDVDLVYGDEALRMNLRHVLTEGSPSYETDCEVGCAELRVHTHAVGGQLTVEHGEGWWQFLVELPAELAYADHGGAPPPKSGWLD